jgi:ribosomal-protein-alanine N-acetyltransferase
MSVRRARPEDRPAIDRLQQQLPEPAPELLAPVAGGKLLVSVADAPGRESVVGYLLWFPGDPVYAAEMVVHPDVRNEGRGTRLFRAVFDRLEPGACVDLRVAAANEAAVRLYRRLGFERVERLPDAYDSGAGYRMRYVVEGTD